MNNILSSAIPVQRERKGKPSNDRSSFFKKRYLSAPLMVDIEYMELLTRSHRMTQSLETMERRAENHGHALENMTCVIHDHDLIAGNKTRFIRGAIPYTNYAAEPFLQEMRNQVQDSQACHIEQGSGGGIAAGLKESVDKGYKVISGKFLISYPEFEKFKEICEYWEDKNFMEQGKQIWKRELESADYLENGWKIGLFTAPHEPCPEGRLILDYETVLSKGYLEIISGIEQKINQHNSSGVVDSCKISFWKASIRVLEAALIFVDNYAKEAERLANQEDSSERKEELLQIAARCRRVPREPARDFRDAIQSFWFTYLLGHIEGSHLGYSPGRLDMLLYPYYQSDATCSEAEAVSLFEELFVKMTQIEYIASLSWQGLGHGNLYQNCILGGIDEEGKPVVNDISHAILQAQINMQMTQPTLSVWYHESLDENFMIKAIECVKTGVGYPAFFNQKTYIAHELKTSGLPIRIIRKYGAIGGCTEPTLAGHAHGIVQAGFINHGKILDLALNGGVDPISGIRMFTAKAPQTYEELENLYLDILKHTIRTWQRYWNLVMKAHRQTVPLIFCSVFVNDCVEKGVCMDDGGARLNQSITTLSSGLVNSANSLAAVKRLCFDTKECTIDQMRQILRQNWEGHEILRKKALAVPHWGNDEEYVDSIFLSLFSSYCQMVREQENYLGKPYDPTMLAISTPVPFGKVCDAFPDGRKRGEPLADGVTSPFPGTDISGPTAIIRSSSKVDHTQIRGGLLNLKFHPSALKGDRGSRNLLAFIKTYFASTGFHIQFNVVDSRMLRDAQEHPNNYRDLVVRVAGFSAYWVEMSKALQDQVIGRTEHSI